MSIREIKQMKTIIRASIFLLYKNNIIKLKLIFKKILTTLFIKPIFLKNIYPNLNNNINEIFNLNLNTYMIKKKLEKNNFKELKIIKKTIQLFIIKSHIYNPKIIYTNSNDPFTFDMIDDIPFKERFIFNDNNNYYCLNIN